jgi:ankyrin repeat protein
MEEYYPLFATIKMEEYYYSLLIAALFIGISLWAWLQSNKKVKSDDEPKLIDDDEIELNKAHNTYKFMRQLTKTTSTHECVKRNNIEMLSYILESENIECDFTKDGLGQTPLHLAVLLGEVDIVKKLMEHDDEFNTIELNGPVPEWNKKEEGIILEEYLNTVFDNLVNNFDETPGTTLLEWLEGKTALDLAIMMKDISMVKILTE